MLLTLPIYWLLAPVFRRARVLTTADFFEARFGRDFMILYSIFGMFVCTIFTAVLLFGSARLVEALTAGAITKSVGIFSIGIVAFSYGIVGGLIAAVWNDLLQGIMTIVMSTMMIPFFWLRIGGLSHFRQALPDPRSGVPPGDAPANHSRSDICGFGGFSAQHGGTASHHVECRFNQK